MNVQDHEIFQRITNKPAEYYPDKDLSGLTTFGLEARGNLLVIRDWNLLRELLPWLNEVDQNVIFVGKGSNSVFKSANNEDLYIQVTSEFKLKKYQFDKRPTEIWLPSTVAISEMTAFAIKHKIKGWEVFTGIPASLGGSVFMNAGTSLGEIGDLVLSARVLRKNGELENLEKNQIQFSYRKNKFLKPGDYIAEVELSFGERDELIPELIKNYLKKRAETQPLWGKNCGCVFKNPDESISAGKLIDMAGLKNLQVGNLSVSEKHGNFFDNRGGATYGDFKKLVSLVRDKVKEDHGYDLELEAKVPGDFYETK